jgi:hypothetical protein
MNTIRNGKMLKSSSISISILLIVLSTTLAYGHNFSSNESAEFLALVETIKAEAQLVQENLSNNSMTLANEHANKAPALLTAAVYEEIAERNQRLADDLREALTTLKTSAESTSGGSQDIEFLGSRWFT